MPQSLEQIDGWLLFDFRGSNTIALEILQIPADAHLTRRLFYWKPTEGEPVKIVHRIEAHKLDHLPGATRTYASWQELEALLRETLAGANKIAMEVSEIPYLSKVDGGTLDLIRSFGVEVTSSQELVQAARPPLTPEQQTQQAASAEMLATTIHRAWKWIGDHLMASSPITELDVQDFILGEFAAHGHVTDHPPICAVGPHSADPHYLPTDTAITPGNLILIDLWAKPDHPGAVFADLTKVATIGPPTAKQLEVFEIVRGAREAVLHRLRQGPSTGWELDQAARDVITRAGYGEFFIHRTGHDIGEELHGPGTHLDNYETRDTRVIRPGSCFSIEPGIYLPGEFGIRLECNCLIDADGILTVTGDPQDTLTSSLPN